MDGEPTERGQPRRLLDLTFTGERLRQVRDRTRRPSPIPGVLDPEPHLHVLVGRPESGKTSFAVAVAVAWADGRPPWEGCPSLPGSRVLVVSREQPVERVEGLLRRFGASGLWPDRVHVVAIDPDLDGSLRGALTLDSAGLGILRDLLREAREEGAPFGLVVLDSLSRLKPGDLDESNNNDMTMLLDELELVANDFEVYVILVHHQGHGGEGRPSAPRSASRGASAIGAVSAVQLLLSKGGSRERLLEVEGNAVLGGSFTFDVAEPGDHKNAINFFRLKDPYSTFDPRDYLKEGEELSQNKMAAKLAGKTLGPSESASGSDRRLAERVVKTWVDRGLVEERPGERGARVVRLRSDFASSPPPRPPDEANSGADLAPSPIEARGGEVAGRPAATDGEAPFEPEPGDAK